MRTGTMLRCSALLLALLAAGCERAAELEDAALEPTPVAFGRGLVRIETESDTFRLQVEIAEDEQQRAYGLMRRAELPEEAGMIFLYDETQDATASFWMFNTRIPLSIAYLDEDGRIANIEEMEPCPSPYPQWCPTYPAGVPFRSALEVNRGYFERRGIAEGDRVVLER
jgi:uncharacterized protein